MSKLIFRNSDSISIAGSQSSWKKGRGFFRGKKFFRNSSKIRSTEIYFKISEDDISSELLEDSVWRSDYTGNAQSQLSFTSNETTEVTQQLIDNNYPVKGFISDEKVKVTNLSNEERKSEYNSSNIKSEISFPLQNFNNTPQEIMKQKLRKDFPILEEKKVKKNKPEEKAKSILMNPKDEKKEINPLRNMNDSELPVYSMDSRVITPKIKNLRVEQMTYDARLILGDSRAKRLSSMSTDHLRTFAEKSKIEMNAQPKYELNSSDHSSIENMFGLTNGNYILDQGAFDDGTEKSRSVVSYDSKRSITSQDSSNGTFGLNPIDSEMREERFSENITLEDELELSDDENIEDSTEVKNEVSSYTFFTQSSKSSMASFIPNIKGSTKDSRDDEAEVGAQDQTQRTTIIRDKLQMKSMMDADGTTTITSELSANPSLEKKRKKRRNSGFFSQDNGSTSFHRHKRKRHLFNKIERVAHRAFDKCVDYYGDTVSYYVLGPCGIEPSYHDENYEKEAFSYDFDESMTALSDDEFSTFSGRI